MSSGQDGQTTSQTSSSGNSAASDMGPNAISINIGGQGWGVGRSARGGEGPAADQTGTSMAFGDADNYGSYGSGLSPVAGYSLMSGSRAGGRRKRKRRSRRRKTRRSHKKRKRRRRKTRRTRRKSRRRRRRRKRRR